MMKSKLSTARLKMPLQELSMPNFSVWASSMLQNAPVHGGVCPETAIKRVFGAAVLAFFALAAGRLPPAYADAPNTFTYQGRLKVSNSPVNGNASIAVQFCTAPSGGTCYPAADNTQTVAVSSGLFRAVFNLPTDAGFNLATGPWYLQIYETASGSALSNPLSPREQFTSSPYAMYTTSATYANGLNAASGASIIPVSASLTLANNAAIAMSGTAGTIVTGSSVTASAFFGNGTGLTGVTAIPIPAGSSGQVQFNNAGTTGGAASLIYNNATGNLTLTSTATIQGNAFSVGGSTLVVTSGNVGIGTMNPIYVLDAFGDAGPMKAALRVSGSGASQKSVALTAGTSGSVIDFDSTGFLLISTNPKGAVGNGLGSTLMMITAGGNLGLGTTVPATKLHLSGGDLQVGDVSASTMSAGGYVTMANLSAAPVAAKGRIYFDPTGLGALKISLDGSSFVPLSTGSAGGGISSVVSNASQFTGTGVSGNPLTLLSSSVTLQGNTFNGPNQLVQLNGNGGLILAGSSITLSGANGYITSNSSVTASAFYGDGSHLSGVLTSTGLVASTNTWSAQQNYLNQITISSNLIMNSGGSIGIGTSNPAYKVDVQGVGQINAAGGLCINGQCQSAWAGGFTPWTAIGTIVLPTTSGNNVLVQSTLTVQGNAFSVGGSTLVVASGNVGISTTTPAAPLHVIGNVLIGGGGHLTFGGPLPTLSGGCGTTPTVQGNDVAGIVTIGGAPTSICTLTFANAWPRNPACVAVNASAGPSISFVGIGTSSATFNFSATPAPGAQVSYNCLGF